MMNDEDILRTEQDTLYPFLRHLRPVRITKPKWLTTTNQDPPLEEPPLPMSSRLAVTSDAYLK